MYNVIWLGVDVGGDALYEELQSGGDNWDKCDSGEYGSLLDNWWVQCFCLAMWCQYS